MKFEEAFEETLKRTPKDLMPKGDDNIPKILAFLWSMIAISKNRLDDIAYISENKTIVSHPLQKSSKTAETENKKPVEIKEDGKEKLSETAKENS